MFRTDKAHPWHGIEIGENSPEEATRPAGSQKLFDTAASTDRALKLYEGYYHDLLADTGKEKVMADIQSWIDTRIPADTSAASGGV